jgi:hypothetical protein
MEFYYSLMRSFFTWGKKARDERKARQIQFDKFLRDWSGEPAEPGRDRVPGVMERLNRIDGELQHNGGNSMKDSQRRIEKKLSEIDARLEDGNKRFLALEQRDL